MKNVIFAVWRHKKDGRERGEKSESVGINKLPAATIILHVCIV